MQADQALLLTGPIMGYYLTPVTASTLLMLTASPADADASAVWALQAGQGAPADWAQHGWQEHLAEGHLPSSGAGSDGLLCTCLLLPPVCGRQDLHTAGRLGSYHGGRIHVHGGVL